MAKKKKSALQKARKKIRKFRRRHPRLTLTLMLLTIIAGFMMLPAELQFPLALAAFALGVCYGVLRIHDRPNDAATRAVYRKMMWSDAYNKVMHRLAVMVTLMFGAIFFLPMQLTYASIGPTTPSREPTLFFARFGENYKRSPRGKIYRRSDGSLVVENYVEWTHEDVAAYK